ncbi:DWNN domain-containing protein [Talaromyces proteolyticus]|uniref:DWNN domain-containing protein n=1 Tax=Talaromyces proteolyticus TaxID=1131652 RepID=A0AAD4Q5M1_9EURO|nr:DWNN domain-containing protein [Talaromyces proteolyticus]KAH8704713.1 DWNN domain-containing protein [Talaromyces proteolyticus]
MTSSVHFKFKSQKEPSRVTFDGTGISVFELKREIINQNRLGDGTDFELSIYNEDTGEEYDDDTAIIPRSTSVIARRLPAARPGKGGAARYVSGKMPVTARSSTRADVSSSSRITAGALSNNKASIPGLDSAQTEDEKIDALFNLQANQWKEQQQEMANAIPVAAGRGRGKPINIPDHPPPPGYLCYRCREKGHWIQACPTNNDPKFDGRYRVKRSTGIPRSLQTKVEKSAAMALDGSTEDLKNSGVMVNADGDFVIAQPDKAAWELYQEKVKAAAAAAAEAASAEGSKDLRARGLECPIDKRMFLEPTKTPCCHQTYCNDCITNALIESDFVCPGCSTEGVLLDNLVTDDDAAAKIKAYEAEKAEERKDKEKQDQVEKSNETQEKDVEAPVAKTSQNITVVSPSNIQNKSEEPQSKKRAAEEEPAAENPNGAEPSASMKRPKSNDQQNDTDSPKVPSQDNVTNTMPFPFNQQMPFPNPAFPQSQMPFPDNSFLTGGVGMMNPMMPMNNNFQPQNNNWNQMNGSAFGLPVNGMFADGSMFPGNDYEQFNSFNSMPVTQPNPFMQTHSSFPYGGSMNGYQSQQRTNFNGPSNRDEDNAYFRQPINPHRHQARQRRIRPSDYREL